MYIIHAGVITKKEYTNMSQQLELHSLFLEQVVCRRGAKQKKGYLFSLGKIAMRL